MVKVIEEKVETKIKKQFGVLFETDLYLSLS